MVEREMMFFNKYPSLSDVKMGANMGKDHEFAVDLCSFHVVAKDEEEARKIAIRLLESGEETARIDKLVDLGEYSDDE